MFLWIRDQKWLPTLYLALITLLVFGGLDYLLQGPLALISPVLIATAIFFSRSIPWLAIALNSVGLLAPTILSLQPQVAQVGSAVALLILAGFSSKIQRSAAFSSNLVFGSVGYLLYSPTLFRVKHSMVLNFQLMHRRLLCLYQVLLL